MNVSRPAVVRGGLLLVAMVEFLWSMNNVSYGTVREDSNLMMDGRDTVQTHKTSEERRYLSPQSIVRLVSDGRSAVVSRPRPVWLAITDGDLEERIRKAKDTRLLPFH